jgi:hypothetical protein
MWGNWLVLSAGGTLAVAALIGLVVLGSPIFAIVIAMVLGLVLLVVAALRRSEESTRGGSPAGASRNALDRAATGSRDRGAPAGTEGTGDAPLPASPAGPSRAE